MCCCEILPLQLASTITILNLKVAGAAIVTDLNRRISDPFDVAGHLIPVV